MRRLAGKTALITGAARGIGCHFAQTYASEGARVAIADIDIERARRVATDIGDAAIAIEMDVTSQESIDAAVAAT
ncbi:MAG: SDR family NAD(P)-dependent oxidoreductase, partial [Rhodobiaceae bacterium]